MCAEILGSSSQGRRLTHTSSIFASVVGTVPRMAYQDASMIKRKERRERGARGGRGTEGARDREDKLRKREGEKEIERERGG